MTTRYGVSGATCGPREVVYEQQGCLVCLPIKIGEKQIFDVDFSGETRCNPVRIGCGSADYNEIVNVISLNVTKEVSLSSGIITVSSTGVNPPRNGVVQLLADATNINLVPDESWEISVTVELEDGRFLKQCFKIKATPCGDACSSGSCSSTASNVCGDIISTTNTCGKGLFSVIGEVPSNAACMVASSTVDSFYTLDGTAPSSSGATSTALAAGVPLLVKSESEINGFNLVSADCNCGDFCVSVTFRRHA